MGESPQGTRNLRISPAYIIVMKNTASPSNASLAASITRKASTQTFYTIRFLADPERVEDAYRAYAYFRWVDDTLDAPGASRPENLLFVERQKSLLDACYHREPLPRTNPHEGILIGLVQRDGAKADGLQIYLRNMMAVMDFDAKRRGSLVSQFELNEYSHNLASAVTEAMHHFVGHGCSAPRDDTRYLAVTAAHITHMLRDTLDDIQAGYFNIPREVLEANNNSAQDVSSEPYREWVRGRVALAREYFKVGKSYLLHVENARFRLACYGYVSRFEGVLDAIEREGYVLRAAYPESESPGAMVRSIGSMLRMVMERHRKHLSPLHERSLRGL